VPSALHLVIRGAVKDTTQYLEKRKRMKTINLVLAAILISSAVFGQTRRAEKPQFIQAFDLSEDTLKGKCAWFAPGDKFLVGRQLEKVELGIDLPRTIDRRVKAFFDQDQRIQNHLNPFDRADIDLNAVIYFDGIEEQRVNGFYYAEYRRDLANNRYFRDTTSYDYRFRFSPRNNGKYEIKISGTAAGQTFVLDEFNVFIESSDNKGFLEKGQHSKHFRYSRSKESFHGVGQVIPWADPEGWDRNHIGSGPRYFLPMYSSLRTLNESGGNFTRIVAAPWSLQFEWEALGNYLPKMGQAWEFDLMNDHMIKHDIYYIFCALLHAPFESFPDDKQKVQGVRWEDYCYNDNDRTPAKVAHADKLGVTEVVDFFRNKEALHWQKNYYRYLVARWGYSTALAGWQLASEIDDTYNYRDQRNENGELIDNAYVRDAVRDWSQKIATYMREDCNDVRPNSMAIITGKNYSSYLWDPEMFKIEEFEFVGLHDYVYEVAPPTKNVRNRNLRKRYESVNIINVGLNEDKKIEYPEFQNLMYIYDEFGHILTIPRKWPEDKDDDVVVDFNNCSDFMFKQDMWFTFASGCAIAGLDWWNQHKPKRHQAWKRYMPGIVKFASDIDFEGVNYTAVRMKKGYPYIAQRWPYSEKDIERSNTKPYKKWDKIEAYIQLDSLGQQGFGWMSNRSYHRTNLEDTLTCFKPMVEGSDPYAQPYLYEPRDNDLVDQPFSIEANESFIKIYNVSRGTFQFDFYNTETGEVIDSIKVKSSFGTLKVFAPEMDYKINPDIAFKFYRTDIGWK